MKFASLVSMSGVAGATVVINEVSDAGSSNACSSADWIELLNLGTSSEDIGGYMLCDSKGCGDEDAYTLPAGLMLGAGEYGVVCKGEDGFAFGIGGDDSVTLQDASGNVIDSAGALPDQGGVDITWSRIPDGTGDFKYTGKPTPGAPNVDKEPVVLPDCGAGYSSLQSGDVCSIAWTDLTSGEHRLLPTESSVGHAWVIRQMYDDFETEADATKWLGKKEFPVVLHNGNFYLTDRHHHAAALLLSGHADKMTMVLKVVCDYSSVPEENFWNEMVANNYALAYDWGEEIQELPGPQDFSKMPTSWDMGAFGDNKWRSMAGFASSDNSDMWTEEQRCYIQECEYFVDFAWAYLVQEAATEANDKWPSKKDWEASTNPRENPSGSYWSAEEFTRKLKNMPSRLSVAEYDATKWHNLGKKLLPLCHSAAVENHPLPEFFPSAMLKGWSTIPVASDPDCLPHQCGSSALSSDLLV